MGFNTGRARPARDALIDAVKYQALGNDYWVIDRPSNADDLARLIASVPAICDRYRGLGSDGVLIHEPRTSRIRILNPDGSIAERSGNGLRIAVAHAVLEHAASTPMTIRTSSSDHAATVHTVCDGTVVSTVAIARLGNNVGAEGGAESVEIATSLGAVRAYRLSIGNPHCIVFGLPINSDICRTVGPEIEHHAMFPRRTNVQFVEPIDRRHARIEIWERGAGRTLSSGTSASAVALALMHLGLADDAIEIEMPGGPLFVERRQNDVLHLTGPAKRVCFAQFRLSELSEVGVGLATH